MLTHEDYIKRTITLARQGNGQVSPNPLVGALLVKEGRIIGEGFHQKYGGAHAEVNAIAAAEEKGHSVEGAILYCNLEPCCHTKKQTPPCTDLLIEKKIATIVVANVDPNPEVKGQGLEKLKAAGIQTISGILEGEGKALNEIFYKYISTSKPFVHLKLAQTLDGKIATANGDSKWITDESARKLVHEFRYEYDAVMVGRETLNRDNSRLNVRMGVESKGKVPYRVTIGSLENFNYDSKIFSDEDTDKTVILTSIKSFESSSYKIKELLSARKIKVIPVMADEEGGLNLDAAMTCLGQLKISSVLVEGGKHVISGFINQREYDKLSVFISPKIIGNGTSYFENEELRYMREAITFAETSVQTINNQVLIQAYPNIEAPCSPV